MNDLVHFYTAALPRGPHQETRLLEEIAFLEVRVRDLNRCADCAYEKSLARSYAALLQARRAELVKLRTH